MFLSLLERPRLIGHLAVCRIDNPGRPGIDVTVAGMLLDVLDTAALAPPESLHVRLTVGSPRRRERSCLGERAGMERDRITRTIVWSRRWAATLRVDDHNLCDRRNECNRDTPFHHSSYRLKTVLSLKPQAGQSQMSAVLDRFLRYVQYDTQSDETSTGYPSTSKQLLLLTDLADELRKLGLTDAGMDQYGYVTATVPPTSSKRVPAIGFIAHVDTSPELTGANVRPIVHPHYDGRDLVLPDDPTIVLRMADCTPLAERLGDDIVTASGTTLLGADNKSGVAEIVTAAEYLMAHPEIPHGPIKIAFTPDEEIGRGTQHFDVEAFGATYAYTMDGSARGELEYESFSADAMTLTFVGFNTHPGYAKDRLINAIKVAARSEE